MLLKYSKDPVVSTCKPKLQSGKLQVDKEVLTAEEEIHLKNVIGTPCLDRSGLGSQKTMRNPDKHSHAYRKLVSSTSRAIQEESNIAKAAQLQVQGQWLRWESYVKNDFTWKTLLATPPNLLSFCIQSTFDTLPSPSNLRRWRITTEASCTLCKKEVCPTTHILGGCQIALSQGRFTFRHDTVLKELFLLLSEFLKNIPSSSSNSHHPIKFVKAGVSPPKTKRKVWGILHQANKSRPK